MSRVSEILEQGTSNSQAWVCVNDCDDRHSRDYSTTFEMRVETTKDVRSWCDMRVLEGTELVHAFDELLLKSKHSVMGEQVWVNVKHSGLDADTYGFRDRGGFTARVIVQAKKPSWRVFDPLQHISGLQLPDPAEVRTILEEALAVATAAGEKLTREEERIELADKTTREANHLYYQVRDGVQAKASKATRFKQRLEALKAEWVAEVSVILAETRDEIESDLSAYSSGEVIPELSRAVTLDAVDRLAPNWSPLPPGRGYPGGGDPIGRKHVLVALDERESDK